MQLDDKTLSVIALLTSLMLPLVLLGIGQMTSHSAATRAWTRGVGLYSLGFLLIALRNVIPDIPSIVVSNCLIVLGYGELLHGLKSFYNRPVNRRWMVYVVPTYAVMLLILLNSGWQEMRFIVTSFLICILSFAMAAEFYKAAMQSTHGKHQSNIAERQVLWVFCAVFVISAALMGARGGAVAIALQGGDSAAVLSLVISASYVLAIVVNFILASGFPLLVSRRVQRDLFLSEASLLKAKKLGGLGTLVANLQSKTVSTDSVLEHMLGLNGNGSFSREVWLNIMHPQDRDRAAQALESVLNGRTESVNSEYRIVRPDTGETCWLNVSSEISTDPNSGERVLMSSMRDITELKESALAAVRARGAADEASNAKSLFLANMSHEIRTPMNAILGMLKLLGGTDLNARQADYAGKAESSAKSLLGLLNDILDFSKIEAGKLELDPQPFSMERLLRDLSVIVSSNLGQKSIEVLFDLDSNLPLQLVGDAMRIQQVLINLSGNAVKFTERGEIIIQVKVIQKTEKSATLRIAVKDSGIGISPENQKRLFSDFVQAEASTTRRFGGTGLGLSICKRLVKLMGGDLLVESAAGQGSTFYFEIQLPITQNTVEDAASTTDTNAVPMRVLVVDDNAIARDLIAAMAMSLGWTVDVAQNGTEALRLVQQRERVYQAIFMDWDMPGMDGWETIECIGNLLGGQSTPITVMVTASGREALSQRSAQEQSQLNAFLVKPITASMLREVVADAREGRSNLRSKTREEKTQVRRLNGMRVLVVEDNLINQQVARELLIAEGALVEIADNGLLGVTAVTQSQSGAPFDVVLMDLQMPVMDGFEATRAIRQDLGLTDLPIIAMTANAMASDREACLTAGMNDHVGKPFDLTYLVSVLLNVSGYHPAETSTKPAIVAAAVTSAPSGLISSDIDVEGALARMSGMRTLYARLVGDFVKALDNATPEFERLLAIPSLLDASRHAHTLKGTAATLGATRLAKFASELETLCKSESSSDVLLKHSSDLAEVVHSTQTSLRQVLEVLLPPSAEPAEVAKQSLDSVSSTDINAAKLALNEITGLLANADLAALQRLAELRGVIAVVAPESLEHLENAMQGLEFEAAQKICQEMSEFLNPVNAATGHRAVSL